MPNYDSSKALEASLKDVDTLLSLAKADDNGRPLFLKLSIVLIVTKFEVFIEELLEEFLFSVKGNLSYYQLPPFCRLNSIMLYIEQNREGWISTIYSNNANHNQNITLFKDEFSKLRNKCTNNASIGEEFKLNTKFPLGKHGGSELVKLFNQFEGKDIFIPDDLDKLNSLLNIRHNIIHQDASPSSLTETVIEDHKVFILSLSNKIDSYLYILLAPQPSI